MKAITIIGAGGHTRSSINLIKEVFKDRTLLIYDDSYNVNTEEFIHEIKLNGKIKDIDTKNSIFLSIGDNKLRAMYYNEYSNQVLKENIFHESAFSEYNILMGFSNQVFANVYINSCVRIGDNNIINTAAIIEHETKIGSHNHISVGSKICGRVSIGNNCMLGAGSVIIDSISICDNVIIGAGAVVTENITEEGTYVGVPARKIK